nr:capsule biosynthesis CapC [uncultured bacterium]
MLFVVITYVLFLLGSLPLTALVIAFGRRRVTFYVWELAAFLMPYITWYMGDHVVYRAKTLGNMSEAVIVGLGVPVAALIRVVFGRKRAKLVAITLISLLFAHGLLVYLLTPSLPE